MTKMLERLEAFVVSLTRPYPARDWFAALVVVLAILLGAVAFAGYLFWNIRVGGIIRVPETAGTAPPAVSRGELESVLEFYRARRVNFEAHNITLPPLVDPR